MVSFQKSDTPIPLFIDVSGDFNRHECYYYIGYNGFTIFSVYTHYNEATYYTPSTKSTQQNRESKTDRLHSFSHLMQNGAGKSKRLEGQFNHHTFALKNGQ